jgi:hypothetical protein
MKIKRDGKEQDFLERIKGQEQKIENCRKKIQELQNELISYRAVMASVKEFKEPPVDLTGYCGKILYISPKAAQSAMRLINRDLKKAKKPPLVRSYHCVKCDAWHLTTMPSWLPYPETGGYTNESKPLTVGNGCNSI